MVEFIGSQPLQVTVTQEVKASAGRVKMSVRSVLWQRDSSS